MMLMRVGLCVWLVGMMVVFGMNVGYVVILKDDVDVVCKGFVGGSGFVKIDVVMLQILLQFFVVECGLMLFGCIMFVNFVFCKVFGYIDFVDFNVFLIKFQVNFFVDWNGCFV